MKESLVSSVRTILNPCTHYDREFVQQKMAELLELCIKSEICQGIDIHSFVHWAKPAILHQQYSFLFTEGDIEPTGYICWAWVDNSTLMRYLTSQRFILHPSEWNEGDNFIVVDFIYSHSKNLLRRDLLEKYRKLKNEKSFIVHYRIYQEDS
ncbi:toxin-activating lysine-acyltransferase [Dryocola clanedunensis]